MIIIFQTSSILNVFSRITEMYVLMLNNYLHKHSTNHIHIHLLLKVMYCP